MTKMWKVFGVTGHRQKVSFQPSKTYFFERESGSVAVGVFNADITGTNDFSVVVVSAPNDLECENEFSAQLSDGVFENARIGRIEEINGGEEE